MKKIVKLTESDLNRIVRKAMNEMEGEKIGDQVEYFVSLCDEVSSAYQDLQDAKDSGDYRRLNNKISKMIFAVENLLTHGKKAHLKLHDKLNDSYRKYKETEN